MVGIIEEIISGDKEKFSLIMDEYYKQIYSYLYRQTRDEFITADLTQDVFIKVYNNLRKYNHNKSSLKTWIYRIATNHMINYFKKRKIEVIPLNFDIKSGDDILDKYIEDERINDIASVISTLLSNKQKQVMIPHLFSDMSAKEISESLNIPLKTVYSNINVSTEKIKKGLGGVLWNTKKRS